MHVSVRRLLVAVVAVAALAGASTAQAALIRFATPTRNIGCVAETGNFVRCDIRDTQARKPPRLVWGKRRAGKDGAPADAEATVDQEIPEDEPGEIAASERAALGFMITGKPGQVRLRLATREELEW